MSVTHEILEKTDIYKELMDTLNELNNSFVKAGFPDGGEVGVAKVAGIKKLSGSIDDQKAMMKSMVRAIENKRETMSEVATIAAWNEFGTPNGIPSRPFMRNFFDGKIEEINEMTAKLADLALAGKAAIDVTLERLGLYAQNGIRKSIRDGSYTPNTKRTIAAKGSSKPLIDTSQMINSVTFVKVPG